MRLSHGHRGWVYWSGALLLVSGTLWLLFHYFLRVHGQFGEAPHPLESWWLRLHGAAAMLGLVVLGSLLPVHVRRGWHQRRNLLAGTILGAVGLLLIASGYALYYFGGEELRPWISAFHWMVGLSALPLLVWHISRGREASSRSNLQRTLTAASPAASPSAAQRKLPA
jgi:predicted permease